MSPTWQEFEIPPHVALLDLCGNLTRYCYCPILQKRGGHSTLPLASIHLKLSKAVVHTWPTRETGNSLYKMLSTCNECGVLCGCEVAAEPETVTGSCFPVLPA